MEKSTAFFYINIPCSASKEKYAGEPESQTSRFTNAGDLQKTGNEMAEIWRKFAVIPEKS